MTHLFLYVMDTLDGSTFSVRVSSGRPDEMVISPQIKCSGEAIARFYQHILKQYPDAQVREEE